MRLRHSLSIGVMVLAATATASLWSAEPQTTASAAAPSTPRIEHETFALPNGLKVIRSQDKRLPMVAVNLWHHVGPANEIRDGPGSRSSSNT